jgi:hypothetical protein
MSREVVQSFKHSHKEVRMDIAGRFKPNAESS